MRDDIELYYNEETGCWEKEEEPYMTLEFPTKDDYELLMKKADFYDKNHDNIEQVKKQAVKEFAEKLKEKYHNYYPSIDHYCCSEKAVNVKDINKLLKEYEEL